MNGYAASYDTPLWLPYVDSERQPEDKLVALYQVSTRLFTSGHACTETFRLDMRTRQMLAIKLACHQAVVPSERVALEMIRESSAARLRDLSEG